MNETIMVTGGAGFLGSQRNGRGIVFHVTELD
jgi:nucleoside-diphosphate-sugar epimerase